MMCCWNIFPTSNFTDGEKKIDSLSFLSFHNNIRSTILPFITIFSNFFTIHCQLPIFSTYKSYVIYNTANIIYFQHFRRRWIGNGDVRLARFVVMPRHGPVTSTTLRSLPRFGHVQQQSRTKRTGHRWAKTKRKKIYRKTLEKNRSIPPHIVPSSERGDGSIFQSGLVIETWIRHEVVKNGQSRLPYFHMRSGLTRSAQTTGLNE